MYNESTKSFGEMKH